MREHQIQFKIVLEIQFMMTVNVHTQASKHVTQKIINVVDM